MRKLTSALVSLALVACGDPGDSPSAEPEPGGPPAGAPAPTQGDDVSTPPTGPPNTGDAVVVETPGGPPAPAGVSFDPALGLDFSQMTLLESGLYLQDISVGIGTEATPRRNVAAHYTGWISDGTQFDSSIARGQPYAFVLGVGQAILGWDQGLAGMRVGGRRRLVVPPHLGYGDVGSPPTIPPNAWLVFELQLVVTTG